MVLNVSCKQRRGGASVFVVCISVRSVCVNPKEVDLFCFGNFIIYLIEKDYTLYFFYCFFGKAALFVCFPFNFTV